MRQSQRASIRSFFLLIFLRHFLPWSALGFSLTRQRSTRIAWGTTTTATNSWISALSLSSSASSTSTSTTGLNSKNLKELNQQKEQMQPQRENSRQQSSSSASSLLLTPYQILLPYSFPTTSTTSGDAVTTGHDLALPLRDALLTMRRALQHIIAIHNNDNDNDNLLPKDGKKILRIEHVISHAVDPLAWLDAQQQSQQRLKQAIVSSASVSENSDNSTALFYMATQEGQAMAGVGSSLTLTDTKDLFDTEWWYDLPLNSRFYGGARFDSDNNNNKNNNNTSTSIADEWKDFGKAFWMLPTVELSCRNETASASATSKTVLAVHLVLQHGESTWKAAAQRVLNQLSSITHHQSDTTVPPTTLPPVLSRDSNYYRRDNDTVDAHELYEQGVAQALLAINNQANNTKETCLEKVVLARLQKLHLGVGSSSSSSSSSRGNSCWSALNLVKRWKYSDNQEGGHLFYLRPHATAPEFFGCTPERLFQIGPGPGPGSSSSTTAATESSSDDWFVQSEALAGTRPRGSTQQADDELLQDLFASPKDRKENMLTGSFIESVFEAMQDKGWIHYVAAPLLKRKWRGNNANTTGSSTSGEQCSNMSSQAAADNESSSSSGFFVRRLLHVQHICKRYSATVQLLLDNNKNSSTTALLSRDDRVLNVTRYLLEHLHPTPAVCGLPTTTARQFIRDYESIGFDRGFYSGPIGYIGREASDILVAIRSGLVVTQPSLESKAGGRGAPTPSTSVLTYAGAGIVSGSTFQGEWTETNYKLAVVSSLFPKSPIALEGAATPNVAWATAFVEELIRNGVTQFYVCPGSRSTPLVVAIAKATRSHVGIVNAVSVHDERSAGFRAVGYARGADRPAAVITSSGTAVANLYPSIVEAGMDGIPMIILTADRPYENRHSGANQAIDQVKVFSSTFVRWFRDMLPPDDQVPVSVILSDAAHAVRVSRTAKGPVHLNMQFRENLAPDAGPIRSDDRVDAVTRFNGFRFTDVPGYKRWSATGDRWTKSYRANSIDSSCSSVLDIANLIASSKRGMIVVGNLRNPTGEERSADYLELIDTISSFAQGIGFPIFAGVQSASLRFQSPAVVPFAEHILKCPEVAVNLEPDLILQIGSPLVSTAIPNLLRDSRRRLEAPASHVLIHPHFDNERADPGFTATHTVSSEITPFLNALSESLDGVPCSSELAPIVLLGRKLQSEMKGIIEDSARIPGASGPQRALTEPELVVALSETICESSEQHSLFLSNSMPVRDCEFFLYPFGEICPNHGLGRVGTNRGASGIDGIISSAAGFAESTKEPATLVIGDVAALHDIGAMHALSNEQEGSTQATRNPSLTTIIVNNGGGGIFSFLPIAQHGAAVSFDEFFRTPTSSFSFERGTAAFGLPVKSVSDILAFREAYQVARHSNRHSVIEARVADHDINVVVHKEITRSCTAFVRDLLDKKPTVGVQRQRLPVKLYSRKAEAMSSSDSTKDKTLILLHGWMGDKSEWDEVASLLVEQLPPNWRILSVDLPGHGNAPFRQSSDIQAIRSSLRLETEETSSLGINEMAVSVLTTLRQHHCVEQIDALAGYSLGGRVALAMKRLCETSQSNGIAIPELVKSDTRIVLLSANPGSLPSEPDATLDESYEDIQRIKNDDKLASEIIAECNKSILRLTSASETRASWGSFLARWYSSSIWGRVQQSEYFHGMIAKRSEALTLRSRDFSLVLSDCSPPRNERQDWRFCLPGSTLFLAGSLDPKYSRIGKSWTSRKGVCFEEVPGAGHALLLDAPSRVSELLNAFLTTGSDIVTTEKVEDFLSKEVTGSTLTGQLSSPTSRTVEKENDGGGVKSASYRSIGALEFAAFSIDLVDKERKSSVFGIGWGEKAAANESSKAATRAGFVIQITALNGIEVGVGEVSPLQGLHDESMQEAQDQLFQLQRSLDEDSSSPVFDASSLLSLSGEMQKYLKSLALYSGIDSWLPSVHSGLEMALLSVASQVISLPLHQALSKSGVTNRRSSSTLAINGLITRVARDQEPPNSSAKGIPMFPSTKVKVGHQSLNEDALVMSKAFQRSGIYEGLPGGNIRADANRAWNESQAIEFASALDGIDLHSVDRLEFIEEPLEKQTTESTTRGLRTQIDALERWYRHTGIRYALDETLADLVFESGFDYDRVGESLANVFEGHRGCAAFILKPALLGIELSLRIARFARTELGIGAVFSSSFDSGIGLAYTAFLGCLSDGIESNATNFPHGVGTFTLLSADTLSPPFASYVNEHGILNTASLSRAFYGLSLDDMRTILDAESTPLDSAVVRSEAREDCYEASTATSSSGNEISVVVSLSLPFSATVACSYFTDLPQHSRWSPWISSVSYQGMETEWTLNVRGIPIRWRATSKLLPVGIQWESVSGLRNQGRVEFLAETDSSCHMNVHMTIWTSRLLRPLFKGSSVFLEDFLRNKLLKWSLETFRDVVAADLALERGDVELGDALYGAAEGKAIAIEASLNGTSTPTTNWG